MLKIIELLHKNKGLPDHPHYHPEGTTLRHIALVTLRAIALSGDPNLVCTALFHDITKFSDGEMREADFSYTSYNKVSHEVVTGKSSYWSNRGHGRQAEDLIMNDDDIRYFIKSMGADPYLVSKLCRYHMGFKQEHIPSKAKSLPLVDEFKGIDSMLRPFKTPTKLHKKFYYYANGTNGNPNEDRVQVKKYYGLRGKTINYLGMTNLDLGFRRGDRFTMTINRTPYRYRFEDIPRVMEGFDRYGFLGDFFRKSMEIKQQILLNYEE